MEEAGDGIGVGDDLEDTHAAAALAAEGDVDGEDPGEEIAQPMRRGLGEASGADSGLAKCER